MSKEITEILKEFGLTERESEVYIFLAKNGVLKGGDIAKNLKFHKAQVYRILKTLESKGIVESTLEFPMRFTAVPFDKVLDLQVKTKREEARFLENRRADLLSRWASINESRIEPSLEKFIVIEGSNKIYSKIFQMIEEAKKEIITVISGFTLIQAVQQGVDEIVFSMAKKNSVRLRLLTQTSKENIKILKENVKKVRSENLLDRIEGRNISADSGLYTRFMIKDDEEVIFFLASREDSPATKRGDVAVWTNSKAIIHVLRMFSEELWLNATPISGKIDEIESGNF